MCHLRLLHQLFCLTLFNAIILEQIDNLSSIASGFSNFAQMPAATIERINLIESIQKAVELFQGSESYAISFKSETTKAEIYADKEQMSRVFLNIIKNAIQSIPA
jgi:nitrogen fixation/metabolism regulation signal transduction histidine kinase